MEIDDTSNTPPRKELESLVSNCPDFVVLYLNNAIWACLQELVGGQLEVPFASEVDFLQLQELIMVVQSQIYEVKRDFQNSYVSQEAKAADSSAVKARELIQHLEQIKVILEKCTKYRLWLSSSSPTQTAVEETAISTTATTPSAATAEKKPFTPRVLRLAKRLGLTEKETNALLFALIVQCGTEIPSDENTGALMAKFSGMTMKECMDFINPSRVHIKQGLIQIESSYRSDSISTSSIKMSKEAVLALVGSELTATQFLKIDKTELAEVLMEEPGFSSIGTGGGGCNAVAATRDDDTIDAEEEEDTDLLDPDLAALEEELENMGPRLGDDGAEEQDQEEDGGEDFDLYKLLRKEGKKAEIKKSKKPSAGAGSKDEDDRVLAPYTTDIDYLDDHFQLVATKIKIKNTEADKDNDRVYRYEDRNVEAVLRELRAKERMYQAKCEKRMQLTKDAKDSKDKWIPRLERLAIIRKLDDFEKWILLFLVSGVISHDVHAAMGSNERCGSQDFNVGFILWILCDNLEERMLNRKYFYRSATLIKDGMIRLSDRLSGDLFDCSVDIDRRMLDFIVGLETEFNEIVEGSHMYFPRVKLENVVLPEDEKKLIVSTVSNFETFKSCRKKLGFDDLVTYGSSLVLLFFGESGTGKTMMANALANHLEKRVLLINFSGLNDKSGQVLKYIFREAKINDCLLFFDECEGFFESRNRGDSDVAALLTEIERHDGLVIMATNRPYDLDEAMQRRITLTVEFRRPDPLLRKDIWKKHFPEQIDISQRSDIDWDKLSLNYELSGGLIKNAVLSALSIAVARDGKDPVITQSDLEKGAQLQLRGLLQLTEFDRRVIPSRGLSDLVLPADLLKRIEDIITFEKARKVLFGQWGFIDSASHKQGTTVLISGPTGTGKSIAAEAIGLECGSPLKIVDMAEVVSKYAYSTSKHIEALFKEAKESGAVLVFEMSSDPSSLDFSLLLYHIDHFNGIVIVVTNAQQTFADSFMRRFKFVLEFPFPDKPLRKRLWEKLIPPKVPLAKDVDLDVLAAEYEFSGSNIHNTIFRACAKAALLPPNQRFVSMKMLVEAADEEMKHGFKSISSNARAAMYQ